MVARQSRRVLVVVDHLALPVLAGRRAQALLAARTLATDRMADPLAPEPPVGRDAAISAFPLIILTPFAGQLLALGTHVHVRLLVVVGLPRTVAPGLPRLGLALGHEGFHAQGFHRG